MIRTTPKAVTLFRSTDEGAPKLTASAGSLKTLLKACLVSGYGEKQALGWEMPFEQGNIAVFRSQSPESNRHFLRVSNEDAKFAVCEGYLNMTAASVGTGKFAWNNDYDRFAYCEYNQTDSPHWWLIGHEKLFMLLVAKRNLNDTVVLYFGDVPSLVPQDTGQTILFSNSHQNGYLESRALGFVGYESVLFAKTWTGAENMAKGAFQSLANHEGAGAGYPDKISGGLSAAEMWIYEKGAGYQEWNLRALLSGIFKCQNNLRDLPDGSVVKLDGTDDVFLKFNLHAGNEKNNYLINTSRWDN